MVSAVSGISSKQPISSKLTISKVEGSNCFTSWILCWLLEAKTSFIEGVFMITKDTLVLRSLKENLRTFVFFIFKMDYQEIFYQNKERSIQGRYVSLRHI